MSADLVVLGLTWFVVFLFSTTLHEAGHAWAAYKLGDRTAYEGGQVSLNPLPHIQREPVGMILVPLFTFVSMHWMMGWASAPYDPVWAHRYPKRAAVSLLMKAGSMALPSSGGSGTRLKQKRSRFNEKRIDSGAIAASARLPWTVAATRRS